MNESGAVVSIAEAEFPKPFQNELEFNSPVHENWNIVHTGMLVPEAHQIYICGVNCMRGVVLTAAEMGSIDRFSCVVLEEENIVDGKLEEVTLEGITDVIGKLPVRPRAVLIFPVCMHHFIGCNLRYIYQELERRFPDIDFMRCWMDPIMQKKHLTPEQKSRKSALQFITDLPADPKTVSILGDNFRLDEASDLMQWLRSCGVTVKQVQDMEDYDAYKGMGDAALFLTRSFLSVYGVKALADRMQRPYRYIPMVFRYEEIREQLTDIAACLQLPCPDFAEAETQCEAVLQQTLEVLGDTPIVIDYLGISRPLSLARMLLSHGFHVTHVYLDAVLPEEEADFYWLKAHAPELKLAATIHVKGRVLHGSEQSGKVLAIGPKAAWYAGTSYFVNLVETGELWGYQGIRTLCGMMTEAYETPKNLRQIVPRKGFGCACIIEEPVRFEQDEAPAASGGME